MTTEIKYYEKLNIGTASINQVKQDIKDDILSTLKTWDKGRMVEKQCYHIIGPAGVGKTQICYQIKDEITEITGKEFDIIRITSPVLTRDDFLVPFPIIKEDTKQFKMLYSDFVPMKSNPYGIYVIDEFARGDHPLQQLLWQVQNEYSIHRYEFPQGWFVVSVDNPDEKEYSMNTLEDAAGLRRQSHIYVEVNAKDFLRYGTKSDFHPFVLDYIGTYNDRLYDFEAQKNGMVYANPASWEKVSNLLWKNEIANDGNLDVKKLDTRIAGLINSSASLRFVGFCLDNTNIIKPSDIIDNFESKAKPIVQQLISTSANNKLGDLITSFNIYLQTKMPDLTGNQIKNIHDFLIMMPVDTASLMVIQSDIDKNSPEFRYITKLMKELFKSPVFQQKFFEKLRNPNG